MSAEPSLVVPAGWVMKRDPIPGVDLILSAVTLPDSGYRPRATLVQSSADMGLADLRKEILRDLRGALTSLLVEDSGFHDLGHGDTSYLRVLHDVGDLEVVTEVWTWLSRGTAWTLSASAEEGDHWFYGDVFDELATSFDPAG